MRIFLFMKAITIRACTGIRERGDPFRYSSQSGKEIRYFYTEIKKGVDPDDFE
ncbi:hypothetical protein H0178_39930 [Cytobacillus firmus]|nr:hypothetical protein [Cytobacillus firmus]